MLRSSKFAFIAFAALSVGFTQTTSTKPSVAAQPSKPAAKAPVRPATQSLKPAPPARPVQPKRFAIAGLVQDNAQRPKWGMRMWLTSGNPGDVFRGKADLRPAGKVELAARNTRPGEFFLGEANSSAYLLQVLIADGTLLANATGSIVTPGCDLKDSPPCKASDAMAIGNEHVMKGKVLIGDWTFESDQLYPLTFKMVPLEGYIRLCGRGKATRSGQQPVTLGQGDTVRSLLPSLQSKDQLDREGAAQALGWLARTPEDVALALPALTKALKDASMEVRRDAAEALGRIGDPTAIDALRLTQNDASTWVAAVARESADHLQSPVTAQATTQPDTKAAPAGPCLVIPAIQPGPPAIEKKTGIKLPGALCSGGFSVGRLARDEIADVRLKISSSGDLASCKYALPSQNVGPGVTLAYDIIGAFEFSEIGDGSETYRFEGEKDDPLVLKLEAEKGLTYVKGTGKVVMPSGQSISLPCRK